MSVSLAPDHDSPPAGLVPLVVAGNRERSTTPARVLASTPASGGRVMVVSATVGQGHEGAARELGRRLRARGVEVEIHDYLDALPAAARHLLRDLYQPTVQYAPPLFDTIFDGLERDGLLRRTVAAMCRRAEATVERWARPADVVLTTYPLAAQTLGALREQRRITGPAVTYLTDPAAHATWCHPAVDHHLTVTEATARDTWRYGLSARAAGPLCAPHVSRPRRTRAQVRAELGLAVDAPVVLLGVGSLGMGSISRTVRDLLTHPRVTVVVLCGHNHGLRYRLERFERVVALGWRDDVGDLLAASDVLVHNAGGLALTEALAVGLPAITYRPIAGHGRANAALLERAGIAAWPHDPQALAAALDDATGAPDAPHPRWWPSGADPAADVADVLAAQRAPTLPPAAGVASQ